MIDFLIRLSALGQELHQLSDTEDTAAQMAIVQSFAIDSEDVKQAFELADASSLWTTLQEHKIVMADLAAAFSGVMAQAPPTQALYAASIYTTLVKTSGCPVRD